MENEEDNGSASTPNTDESTTSNIENYEPDVKVSKMDNNDAGSPKPR